ncbi:MAG TPA: PAS domain S-box protein [Turneriella sp.]|nr:PAS domain S-box protein [Turneriella sp.]HNL55882.1 PAS domain S-box protein [Turneriella sp.]
MSIKLYEALVEQSPILIWRAGTDGLCNYFNKTWLNFTGKKLEEELGDGWAKGVHDEDLQACMDYYRSNFEQRNIFEMKYRLMRADGQYRWILDRGCPYYDDADNFAGYIGSCIDITERHTLDLEKEKIYKATVRGTNHILRNMLNQLQGVEMACEDHPELHKIVAPEISSILKEATGLIERLSSVENISEQNIMAAVMPKGKV